jgi:acyl-CoA reductase-like NAD-dependent aldehyde dehydrogenase
VLLRTISPVDGSVYVEKPYASDAEIDRSLDAARRAQLDWRWTTLEERITIAEQFLQAFKSRSQEIAEELTWQMGRPIRYTPNEIRGVEERSRYMMEAARKALADINVECKEGFVRFLRREPVGVVLCIAPWNYPYLTSINIVLPAILAGNAVILKPSHHTPLSAERFQQAFDEAGLPEGVFQYIHSKDADTERMIADPRVDFVAFTGSVAVGHKVQRAASEKFIGVGLELGGKDPAYVREDADLAYTIENTVDGSYFNSGQSCCAIERIYVHHTIYERFVEGFVELTNKYVLGNPLDPDTTLGPMIRTSSADFVRAQIADAISKGARALVDESQFPLSQTGTPYVAPQVLVDVDHSMSVMVEETFGPVVGIMKVASDEEAIRWMNDSPYGLTASIWTKDLDHALRMGQRIETGTVFMNRCDYLDPALAWTGVKDSGRGCTLSVLGYEQLTRPKSYHLKTSI